MTVPQSDPAVNAVAAALPAALAERTPAAFSRLLAHDVRWGAEQDAEQTCHNRDDVTRFYAGLLAGGLTVDVLDTTVSGRQVRARLRVTGPGGDQDSRTTQVVFTVREGLVVDILEVGGEDTAPTCELLYFQGCPNHHAFLPHLHRLLHRNRLDVDVQLVEVTSDEDAQRLRFLGSPSLRVNGLDVEPGADQRSGYGLQCRLYPTPDGLTGTPPDEWVLHALGR